MSFPHCLKNATKVPDMIKSSQGWGSPCLLCKRWNFKSLALQGGQGIWFLGSNDAQSRKISMCNTSMRAQ